MRKVNFLWTLLTAAALSIGFASCSSDNDDVDNGGGNGTSADVAYLSISMLKQTTTGGSRASSEVNATSDESDIVQLYLLMFNDEKQILAAYNNSNMFAQEISGNVTGSTTLSTTNAIKVPANLAYVMIVANPNGKLANVISTLNASSTYTSLNAAITDIAIDEVTGALYDGNTMNKFTMITTIDETSGAFNPNTSAAYAIGDVIAEGLVPVTIYKVGDTNPTTSQPIADEAEAASVAQDNKASMKIERLASKISLAVASSLDLPTDAQFGFTSWLVDGRNSTYYPYAKKTLLSTAHSGATGGATAFYGFNFYTEDPNFDGNTGVKFNSVNSVFVPVDDLGENLDNSTVSPWQSAGKVAYMVENTMAANAQTYQNATRLVIKAQYSPNTNITLGNDWFFFEGTVYNDFAALQTAYATASSNLQAACNNMYAAIRDYYAADASLTLTATDFSGLTTTELSVVENGGEVLKSVYDATSNPHIISWYQKGLCYYYYEIQHDNEAATENAYAKYGVVRNNFYALTLTSVKGAGSPWYPDPNKPGPGDPDPEDPIDSEGGYLGIEIEPGPWIYWTNNIGI